jgi:hypothetical protein
MVFYPTIMMQEDRARSFRNRTQVGHLIWPAADIEKPDTIESQFRCDGPGVAVAACHHRCIDNIQFPP